MSTGTLFTKIYLNFKISFVDFSESLNKLDVCYEPYKPKPPPEKINDTEGSPEVVSQTFYVKIIATEHITTSKTNPRKISNSILPHGYRRPKNKSTIKK